MAPTTIEDIANNIINNYLIPMVVILAIVAGCTWMVVNTLSNHRDYTDVTEWAERANIDR